MAEYNQYRSDSSDKSVDVNRPEDTEDSDEVVYIKLKKSSN